MFDLFLSSKLPIANSQRPVASFALSNMVHFISFHINRAERAGGAEVLAGTAADAAVLIHGGHFHRSVRTFVIHHLDGSCGAVAFTVAATDTVSQHDAILFNPHGVASMDGCLFLSRDGFDGTSGAYLAAARTFGTAIAALKRHHGLHEVYQISGRTQYVVRAGRHAELAGRAFLLHVAC